VWLSKATPTRPFDRIEHTFDSDGVGLAAKWDGAVGSASEQAPRRAARSASDAERGNQHRLREIAGRVAPVALAGEQLLPVAPVLEGLFPRKGLQRGTVVAVSSTSLALAVAAAPSGEGSWTAIVGVPDVGALAAAELGVDLARCALVPDPGPAWPTIVAALLDAIDVVVLRPPARVRAADARRLTARAKERGAVLVLLGGSWPEGPDVRLEAVSSAWAGLGDGHGALASRRLGVRATGRGAAARERRVQVALPVVDPGSGGASGGRNRHMNAP
jgi:hypothetical protein